MKMFIYTLKMFLEDHENLLKGKDIVIVNRGDFKSYLCRYVNGELKDPTSHDSSKLMDLEALEACDWTYSDRTMLLTVRPAEWY